MSNRIVVNTGGGGGGGGDGDGDRFTLEDFGFCDGGGGAFVED